MTPDLETLAARLSEAERRAIIRCKPALAPRGGPIHHRAGNLFPRYGRIMAASWLKSNPFIERYFHGGHMAYRLTETGLQLRNHISRTRGEGE